MTQAELLRHLVDTLETLGAEYMIGGSQAAIYYGEPRLTRDIDVVVALQTSAAPDRDRVLRERRGRHPADQLGLRSLWEQIRKQVE